MDWIIENWYVVLGILALLFCIGVTIYNFFGLPTATQIEKVKEWLKYAVSIAEKDLGSGTGALKLRAVYDCFVTKFPKIALFISFDTFSKWVDEALEWMDKQLSENKSIETLVKGGELDEKTD